MRPGRKWIYKVPPDCFFKVQGGGMTVEVRLLVDGSSILSRPSGPATGNIVLLFEEEAFPFAGWNDFVVVIVEAWISALVRILQGTSKIERVHFMEGPYAVDIGPIQDSAVRLRAFERPDREHALVAAETLPLVESAIAAAEEVLKVCGAARYGSHETDHLDSELGVLRREATRIKN